MRPSVLADSRPGDRRRLINGARLEIDVQGGGEPLLFLPTALVADELLPITRQAVLADAFQTVAYSRRGYAGSSPADPPGSIARDAADAGIHDALRIERAHVVSLSFSGAIAPQLASGFPGRVHSLTLIEPPPVHVPSGADFWAATARLQQTRRGRGIAAALNEFMTLQMGEEDWRSQMQRHLPGSGGQMERDATTFFDVDMTASPRFRPTPPSPRALTAAARSSTAR